jgi:hypothetical protein
LARFADSDQSQPVGATARAVSVFYLHCSVFHGTMVAMSTSFDKLLTPEADELQRKQERLAELEAQHADRELERALQTLGRRAAILDDLKANIAEVRAQ